MWFRFPNSNFYRLPSDPVLDTQQVKYFSPDNKNLYHIFLSNDLPGIMYVVITPTLMGLKLLENDWVVNTFIKPLKNPPFSDFEIWSSSVSSIGRIIKYDETKYTFGFTSIKTLNIICDLIDILSGGEEAIDEMKDVGEYIFNFNPKKIYKHNIKEYSQISIDGNLIEPSKRLADLIDSRTLSDQDNQTIDDLLMRGADPNFWRGTYVSAMHNACIRHHKKSNYEQLIIKLLMSGANPLYRRLYDTCPYEMNLFLGYSHIIKLFDDIIARRSNPSPTLSISDNIYKEDDAIITEFNTSNGRKYRTSLKRNIDLTPEEKRSFIEMYMKNFPKHGNIEASRKAAIDDIEGENTMVEAILHEGELVGMNLFRMLFQDNKNLSIEISICLVNPEHRHKLPIPLLLYRIACAYQIMNPRHDVYAFLLMISWIIFYKIYKDVLNTSLRFSQNFTAVLNDSLKVSLGNYNQHCNGLTNYVTDQVELTQEPRPVEEQSISERFFREILLDLQGPTRGRAHPGLCVVGDQLVAKLADLNLELGINFYKHIIQLASCMSGERVSFAALVALNKNTYTLFHENKREVGNLKLPVARL